ncbi:phospholipase [Gracilibacillus salinarum]|uniref:Phospholipase n=1 Tax=Gracilibacillus salinarum TaxID=2932255 RepID=A0ABY4GKK1_9BACI|nr:phospholipase [Gracilibacillus salinarum]UOQ84485.1 phospholipase [Gracilibacillus salinarum]
MYNQNHVRKPKLCIFPGYRWCGPGCSGPGAPINEADAACKAHDECYLYSGDRCACDEAFIQRLRYLAGRPTEEGHHARVMLRYMKVQRVFTCGF